MVLILNNFLCQLARCMFNSRDAGIKSKSPYAMTIINSNEKNLIYNFGNDFYFENEEFCL